MVQIWWTYTGQREWDRQCSIQMHLYKELPAVVEGCLEPGRLIITSLLVTASQVVPQNWYELLTQCQIHIFLHLLTFIHLMDNIYRGMYAQTMIVCTSQLTLSSSSSMLASSSCRSSLPMATSSKWDTYNVHAAVTAYLYTWLHISTYTCISYLSQFFLSLS